MTGHVCTAATCLPTPALSLTEQAQLLLIAHQRATPAACQCGWSEYGRSHSGHVVEELVNAGLLAPGGAQ